MRDVRRECSTITKGFKQPRTEASSACGGGGGSPAAFRHRALLARAFQLRRDGQCNFQELSTTCGRGALLSNLQNASARRPHLPFKAVTVQEPTSRHRCLCVKQRKMQFATPSKSNLSGSLGDRPRARAGGGSSSTRRYNGCIWTAAFLQSLFVTFFVGFSKYAGQS